MGLTTSWAGTEPKGVKTNGTHETNAISLCIDTELAGGTLIVLLDPSSCADYCLPDYSAPSSPFKPSIMGVGLFPRLTNTTRDSAERHREYFTTKTQRTRRFEAKAGVVV